MNQSWKDKTCERCVFNVAEECRRLPPDTVYGYPVVADYEWTVGEVTATAGFCDKLSGYKPACAEYAESLGRQAEDE